MKTLTMLRSTPYVPIQVWMQGCNAPSGEIPEGFAVEYLAHVVGGMVRVRYAEDDVVIHPANTVELSAA